jgi:predicted AlkP superfamily phosphohydrolase/phosphomutase/Tfp pilus assembly protein PilF
VLGIDGLEPTAIAELTEQGRLPHFERLRKGGVFARLYSQPPLLSPVIWTTVATGRPPIDHGIGHFAAFSEKADRVLPVTSRMRKVPALWNIMSAENRRVAVVGWWATWPAEVVNGAVVSDHTCYHFLFRDGIEGQIEVPAKTYPEELMDEIGEQVRRPADLSYEEVSEYLDISRAQFDGQLDFFDDVFHFKWALATTLSYSDIGLELWKEVRPHLEMVYIEGTDTTSHLFGHLWQQEELYGELAEQKRRYGRAVESMYELADRIIGEYLAVMDENTTLVVLSDHGFQLGKLLRDPSTIRDMHRPHGNVHLPEGVLYLYGAGVRDGATLEDPTILDIAPTILALAGLPPSAEMPGRVLKEALTIEPPPRVPSYDDIGVDHASVTADGDVEAISRGMMAKLEALGYLDTVAPVSDRVLLAQEFERGNYEELEQKYRALLREAPESADLLASLGAVLGQQGKLREAAQFLDRAEAISPMSTLVQYNQGVLARKRGETEAALERFRTAVRLDPGHELARKELERLSEGLARQALVPERGPQKKALELAREAAQLARRGGYEEAWALLERAEQLAPELPVIHRYQANVAYLRGDREEAIEALEKGLELRPNDVIFKENLEALRRSGPGGSR